MELLTPAFVGRDRELATVIEALARPPALVLVEGEAGIGKTRLLRECLSVPVLAGRTVLAAVCPPSAQPAPLGPIVSGLRKLRQHPLSVKLSPLGGALRPLFPEWAGALPLAPEPLDDPAEVRHRLFAAIQELVDRLGVDLLVVEDAHWADAATLEFLLMLTTSGDPSVSVVVTYRPTDLPEASLLPRLTSRLPADMSHARIQLEPLDVSDAGRLVASMLATDSVSGEFVTLLHDRTDGVPLALEETVLLLADRHDIRRRGTGWTRRAVEQLQVPHTVRDSVLERVSRLDPDTRRILETAAVLAEPADQALLTGVAGMDDEPGRRGMAVALAAGLLQETAPERFEFRHALAARAVYEAIPVSDRRRLHRRAAEALAATDPQPLAQLARHSREANDTAGWSRYAEAAADIAVAAGDSRTAIRLLLDVLTAAELPLDRRARLARKLGQAAADSRDALGDLGGQVVTALHPLADDHGLPADARAEIRMLLGIMLSDLGEAQAAYEQTEAALPDLEYRPDLAVRAMLVLARPLTPAGTTAGHLKWLNRATDLVQKDASPSDLLRITLNRAVVLLLLGEEAGWQAAEEIPEPSPDSPFEQRAIPQYLLFVAQAATVWGRYDQARRLLATVKELAQATGHQRVLETEPVAEAVLDWYTGGWSALVDTIQAITQAEDTHPLGRVEARLVHGMLELTCGDRATAERQLREVWDEFGQRELVEPEAATASAALGRLCLGDGKAHEALTVTEPTMEVITRKGLWLWATDIAPVRVEALLAADWVGEADELVDQFATWASGRDAPAPCASLATCQAILAESSGDDPGVVASLFADAATAWAGLPRPYDELLAIERQGRCLLAADKTNEALTLLTDAEQRLAELGARFDADRIAHLLRSHGIEVKRAWRGGRRGYGDQLSPRELEVVRLVATGLTNPQVGEQLFLSPKTVAQHLSAAMRKLDVSSRTALVMAASEAGLLKHDHNQAHG